MATEIEIQRVETVARILHKRQHRMGSGHVCDKCRELARTLAEVLQGTTERNNPPPAT